MECFIYFNFKSTTNQSNKITLFLSRNIFLQVTTGNKYCESKLKQVQYNCKIDLNFYFSISFFYKVKGRHRGWRKDSLKKAPLFNIAVYFFLFMSLFVFRRGKKKSKGCKAQSKYNSIGACRIWCYTKSLS
jgi:hypothetical protein